MPAEVQHKSFVGGNPRTNAQDAANWINNCSLAEDQLVSITMNESFVSEGENMITVIYRTERAERPDSVPLSKVEFILFDDSKTWESLDV